MIELILLAVASQETPPPPPAYADDIVVIAEQMKAVNFKAGFEDGVSFCEVTQSSGDPDIDAIVCKSVDYCSDYTKSLFERLADTPRRHREKARAQMNEAMGQCMFGAHERFVEDLAEQRWLARQDNTGEAE